MIDFLKQISILYYKVFPKLFGIGYNQYKISIIKKILENKEINLNRYIDERIVEIPWIMQNLNFFENNKILDAGCTLNFNYLIKKIIKKKNKLTFINLYPEKNVFKSNLVNYETQDITDMKFESSYFDAITCISVIEHIGHDNSIYNIKKDSKSNILDKNLYKKAIIELKRVLKPNKCLYLTIPFGKKMTFRNYQQFDIDDLNLMLNIFSPKEYFLNFYKYENLKWNKVDYRSCKHMEAIYEKEIGISSNSVALVKLKK